jgi:biotin-dependent carboxylase-like uncharacterized protein
MVEVISGGLYTTIQDMGRFGFRKHGVPLSGAMDSYSALLANSLVGNEMHAAVLEITYIGPVLCFTTATQIAITGAGFSPTVNNREISLNTRVHLEAGSTVKFGLPAYGLRAYVSVFGGFQEKKVMDSYSYCYGITEKQSLASGDQIPILNYESHLKPTTASVKVRRTHFTSDTIEAYPGPEFHILPKAIREQFLASSGKVLAESNRMAYLLSGFESYSAEEIITGPVQSGTVQLTPSGRCIVLMRDAQTTGGYARVLQLSEAGINTMAQKRAGDVVHFDLITD